MPKPGYTTIIVKEDPRTRLEEIARAEGFRTVSQFLEGLLRGHPETEPTSSPDSEGKCRNRRFLQSSVSWCFYHDCSVLLLLLSPILQRFLPSSIITRYSLRVTCALFLLLRSMTAKSMTITRGMAINQKPIVV